MAKGEQSQTQTQNTTATHDPWAAGLPYITGGLQNAQSLLQTGGNPAGVAAVGQLATDTAQGKYLTSGQHYITDMIPALKQQLLGTMNGQRDQSQANGAFGGDRMQLAQGQAVGDFTNNLASLYAQQYQQERQLQQNAGTLLNQGIQGQWAPLNNYANIVGGLTAPYGTVNQTGTSTTTANGGGNGLMEGLASAAQIASLFM